MLRLGLRNVLAHRLRFVLCTVAVLLGVAFVAGSMVFTDSLASSLRRTMASTVADLTVTPASALESAGDSLGNSDARPPLLDNPAVERVSEVRGVQLADAQLAVGGVHLVGKDGRAYDPGRPMFGAGWAHEQRTATFTLLEGTTPWGRGELSLDRNTARRAGYQLGDEVRLVTATGTVQARLVALTTTATTGPAAGSPLVAFDPATAQLHLLGESGWTSVALVAGNGVDAAELRDRVQAAGGDGVRVQTAQEVVRQAEDAVDSAFGAAGTALGLFAGLALFVGAFLIFNTFAVTVTQRVRELGLLRAVGASRSQVTRSVLAEALVIGAVGSTGGLLIGIGLVLVLRAALGASGVDLPDGGVQVTAGTVIWCYLLGIGITIVSAYLPARRAGKLAPVEALRDDVSPGQGSLWLRLATGGVALAAGFGGYYAGRQSPGLPGAVILGLSGAIALVGTMLVCPLVARYAVLALTGPARRRPTVLLGAKNAERNPRRTSATAAALMIALAVIGGLAVLASSAKASIDKDIAEAFGTADFVVTGTDGQPFAGSVAEAVGAVDGVASVGRQRSMGIEVADHRLNAIGVDPEVLRGPIVTEVEQGSLDRLDIGAAALPSNIARTLDVSLGDTVSILTRSGTHRLQVGAVLGSNRQLDAIVTSVDTFTRIGGGSTDSTVYVVLRDGVDPGQAGQRLAAAVAGNPLVEVRNQAEYAESRRGPVDMLAGAVYLLLALAVLIAVLGIVNTLLLSVIERTREIGLLRAIGMERPQVREMVRVESIAIALLGAVLGLLIGVVFAAAIQDVMRDDGIAVLDIPVLQLIITVLAAAIVGVLAAVWPARRAARLDILTAIATE